MTPQSHDAHNLRETNKAAFTAMLEHLGHKEFDAFEQCLAPDIFQDWPYLPIPNMPSSIIGRKQLRDFIEAGSAQFDPYAYRIHQFYDLVDPSMLIVEYTSHTIYHPTGQPYSNTYLGIVRFDSGKIIYWREYLNPLIIKETMLGDFEKTVPLS